MEVPKEVTGDVATNEVTSVVPPQSYIETANGASAAEVPDTQAAPLTDQSGEVKQEVKSEEDKQKETQAVLEAKPVAGKEPLGKWILNQFNNIYNNIYEKAHKIEKQHLYYAAGAATIAMAACAYNTEQGKATTHATFNFCADLLERGSTTFVELVNKASESIKQTAQTIAQR